MEFTALWEYYKLKKDLEWRNFSSFFQVWQFFWNQDIFHDNWIQSNSHGIHCLQNDGFSQFDAAFHFHESRKVDAMWTKLSIFFSLFVDTLWFPCTLDLGTVDASFA